MSTLLSERRQPITAPKLWDRVPAQRSTPRTSARHEPAAAIPSHPVVTPRASWSLMLGSIVATVCESDTDLPRIRFVMDTEIPVFKGTRRIREAREGE